MTRAPTRWQRSIAVLRRVQFPLAVAVLYVGVDALFTVVAGHDGLLAPFGAVHLGTLLLGLLTLGLRIIVVFVVLPWAAFRLVPTRQRSSDHDG
jgi:uncharacterized BrkB/YihY/UPF0761 family membrane protein